MHSNIPFGGNPKPFATGRAQRVHRPSRHAAISSSNLGGMAHSATAIVSVCTGVTAAIALQLPLCWAVERTENNVKEFKAEFKADLKDIKAELKAEFKELKDDLKADLKELQAQME